MGAGGRSGRGQAWLKRIIRRAGGASPAEAGGPPADGQAAKRWRILRCEFPAVGCFNWRAAR